MPTRSLSVRLDPATLDRLEAHSRETGESTSNLIRSYVEEGLRMDAHPGIVFRDGPTGRRAALPTGPDVWELIPAINNPEAPTEREIKRVAKSLNLSPHQVRAAVRYYNAYRDEVDTRIRRNNRLAERLYAEYWGKREQATG